MRSHRPDVPGIAEVLTARFVEHAYPLHTHDTWTLLLVEDGAVHYDLDRRPHDTGRLVTLLPRTSRTTAGPRRRRGSANGSSTSTPTRCPRRPRGGWRTRRNSPTPT